MKRISGRVAVVTGAGSGIGRATSLRLAAAGCDLAIVDINGPAAEESAELVRQTGRRASVHVADVANKQRMEALPVEVLEAHGHVEILINNAGVTIAHAFEDHSLDDLEWIVGVNLWGVLYGCKFFLPHLRASDEAHVVNVSSMAGLLGLPMQSSYCATKAAVRGFTQSLAAELCGTHVGVTAVFPGPVRTNVLRSSRHAADGGVEKLADLLERHARPPRVVADKILTAISRNQSHVTVGALARLTDWFSRLSPSAANGILGWSYRRAKTRWALGP
ncbi:MAG TPA: SDR family NAD(P)-dependent oxidoreductase [Polyangiales bacterium]|nr:SDR family NAD(P)-dependent oxidoreductase [Polyangiales bacterium]